MKREITLLFVGAIISILTAFVTNSFNQKRETRRMNIQKKLELNDQISKDLGKRLFLTYELYKEKRENNKNSTNTLNQYRLAKEDWNLKIYSYQSLLNYYYGKSVQESFIKEIYNPLVLLGQEVEYDKINQSFEKDYVKLKTDNVNFISKLFSMTDE